MIGPRVDTDPGKVWKILEFSVEISKVLKVTVGMEKSLKTVMLENATPPPAFASFLAFHETEHLKFKLQKSVKFCIPIWYIYIEITVAVCKVGNFIV